MSRPPTNLIAIVGQPVRLFLLISSCTFAKCHNFRLDRAQYFVSGDRGCLYTEPGLDAGLGSFSSFPPFSPPTSYITIKRRVCRAIREGKLELGSWLGLGGFDTFILFCWFVEFIIIVIIFFAYRKIRKVLTRVLARSPSLSPGFDVSLSPGDHFIISVFRKVTLKSFEQRQDLQFDESRNLIPFLDHWRQSTAVLQSIFNNKSTLRWVKSTFTFKPIPSDFVAPTVDAIVETAEQNRNFEATITWLKGLKHFFAHFAHGEVLASN